MSQNSVMVLKSEVYFIFSWTSLFVGNYMHKASGVPRLPKFDPIFVLQFTNILMLTRLYYLQGKV